MKYTEYQQLTYNDLMQLLKVEKRTAEQVLKDIKQTYETPKVLFQHFKMYFKVQ